MNLERCREDIVAWAESKFGFYVDDCWIPAGDGWQVEHRRPIVLREYQKRILRHLFTPDGKGRFPYDTIIWSEPKKGGKSAVAALIHEWFALTQEPPNELYIVGNDLEGARSRVYRALCRSIELNPYIPTEPLKLEITFSNGTLVKAIPSDYRGEAGANHGLVSFDEPWGIVYENGERVVMEFTPVPTRTNSVQLFSGYAGFQDESDLWERLYKRGLTGEPIPDLEDLPCYRDGNLFMFWSHEPRQPWQTEAYYDRQRASLRPNAFLRMHGNEWVSTEEAFVEIGWWDRCVDGDHRPLLPTKEIPLTIGIDVGIKHDSAAVVACHYDRQAGKVVLANHRIWQPSPQEPLDIEGTIETHLVSLWENYRVRKVYYDPYQFHRSAQTLTSEGLPLEEFPQTVANLTQMGQNLYELIKGGNLLSYQDDQLRRAISQAIAKETPRGWRLSKKKSAHRIDVVIAMAMACLGSLEEPEEPTGGFMFGFMFDSDDPKERARQRMAEHLRQLYGGPVPRGLY